jgi:2-(1,2-epoxy-1,2-dihydrophenyl)acetyl-CoA isomerase
MIAAQSAKIGLGFVRIGLVLGDGTTYYLPRLVGLGKACELIFTSKIIDAYEAEKIGLVNKVVADNELKSATYEIARTLVEAPPVALQWAKQALYQSLDSSFSSQLRFGTASQNVCYNSEDFVEAVKSFLEKRKPVYTAKIGLPQ